MTPPKCIACRERARLNTPTSEDAKLAAMGKSGVRVVAGEDDHRRLRLCMRCFDAWVRAGGGLRGPYTEWLANRARSFEAKRWRAKLKGLANR